MRADIVIVGQGLAGTLLGWEFEQAGIPFEIVDAGHADAASRVAAGILNPITGRRIVKSWRIEALLPPARAAYRGLEAAVGAPLWREMRVRRFFADERERRVFAEKRARGALAPYAGAVDADGFWIEGAARVDVAALLTGMRARWLATGRLRGDRVDPAVLAARHELVIDCTGRAGATLAGVPWEFSQGEILGVTTDGLDPATILNRGHWVLPDGLGRAKIGATHEPGRTDARPTAAGRAALEASAGKLLPGRFIVETHEAGVRVNLPDRHPVAGRHPQNSRLGCVNGLGAKGALLAPWLARQWVNHLTEGVPFDPEVDPGRFWRHPSSQAWSSVE